MEGLVTLNEKEQRRLIIIGKVDRKEVSGGEAAAILEVSVRQFRRLLAGYRKGGAGALAHGNRGRSPANATDGGLRERVAELAGSKYAGCNTQHLTELLAERESIALSRSTVRRVLIAAGVSRPRKRRAPKHRSRRERYPQEGMLVQIDGSRHDWLEGRGPWMTLVGAIDDATGRVLGALFRNQEDTRGYFELVEGIISAHGIPLAVYRDGHAVFEPPEYQPMSLEEQLQGKKSSTQFGRLMGELGVASIRSRSPQARGRIERLWGTLQDRLVSELRLAGATTVAEANEVLRRYIPKHNRQFVVPAVSPKSSFRKPDREWQALFCLKYTRTVGADNVVRFGDYRLQILPNGRYSYAKSKIEVRESFDGGIALYHEGHRLQTQPAPAEAPKLRKQAVNPPPATRSPIKPPPDHPWRRVAYFRDGPPRW